MPPSADWSTSSFPVVRAQAAKSLTDPGSVARTSMRAPEATVLIAWAVLTIGIGHESPRASTQASIERSVMVGLPSQMKTNWPSPALR